MTEINRPSVKELRNFFENISESTKAPPQKRLAGETGSLNRTASQPFNHPTAKKAAAVKSEALPPTKGEAVLIKEPVKLEVEAAVIQLRTATTPQEATVQKSSRQGQLLALKQMDRTTIDTFRNEQQEATGQKGSRQGQLLKMKQMDSSTIDTFRNEQLAPRRAVELEQSKQQWAKLGESVRSALPNIIDVNPKLIEGQAVSETTLTKQEFREKLVQTIPMFGNTEQKDLAQGLVLAHKTADNDQQREETVQLLKQLAHEADFELVGSPNPKPNHFANALQTLGIGFEKREPIKETPSVFSKDGGLTVEQFADQIKGAKGKAYKALVNDFANSLTNTQLLRLKNVERTGDVLPLGDADKGYSVVGSGYNTDFSSLQSLIYQSILTQPNLKGSQQVYSFYADVLVALENVSVGGRSGNMTDQMAIASTLSSPALERLGLNGKISGDQKALINRFEVISDERLVEDTKRMEDSAAVPDYGGLGRRYVMAEGKGFEAKMQGFFGIQRSFHKLRIAMSPHLSNVQTPTIHIQTLERMSPQEPYDLSYAIKPRGTK